MYKVIYFHLIYAGNWELVKSIVGTKFQRSHVCLHSQAVNRLMSASWLASFVSFNKFSKLQGNGSALLRCATIISVQKLTKVIKSNTIGFLTIQRHSRKILKRILAKDN